MPTTPDLPAGTALLEKLLTYIEAHVAPGGMCPCGTNLDVAISVQAPSAPPTARLDPMRQIFVVECLKCKVKVEITMEQLATWDGSGPDTPEPIPEADWPTCSICHTKHLPKRLPRQLPSSLSADAIKVICGSCEAVSKDIGQIIDVREQETLL